MVDDHAHQDDENDEQQSQQSQQSPAEDEQHAAARHPSTTSHEDSTTGVSALPATAPATSTSTTTPITNRTPVQHHQPAQSPSSSQQDWAADESQPSSSFSHSRQSLNNHSRGFDQSGFPLSNDPRVLQSSPSSPRLQPTYRSTRSLGGSEATSPSRIKIRDLSHIQSFASEEYLARPRLGNRAGSFSATQYEISSMPVADIIEMVAGLLTKITATNDRQHEHLQRPVQAPPHDPANMNSPASCVLAFHGKNVPSITILSYLSRIHKYCPTTYEVFLSLLVYFDRMTENCNRQPTDTDGAHATESSAAASAPSRRDAEDEDEADDRTSMDVDSEPESQPDLSQLFAVDSYNIHRLVIAGVTCASKFFSDVFYTNSRYAKVGGLPLVELNNLELQFLLLNDFRLSIPVEELEAYGTMLVEFYAREIVAQQQAAQTLHESRDSGDEVYMRGS